MISLHWKHPAALSSAGFKFADVFQEVTEYDRTFQLPFNVIACTCRSESEPESYIRNNVTGEIHRKQTGDILFIPCGLPIYIHRKPDVFVLNLHFSMESFPGMDIFAGSKQILHFQRPETVKEMERYFAETDPVTACYGLQKLALEFCLPFIPKERQMISGWRFAEIPVYVRRSVSARMTVADLAEMAGLSVPAFSREFSSTMRCTAKEFIQNELLRKALHFLHIPGMTVREVSDSLGFSSPYYFSKFFKRRYGISPLFYRKNSLTG